MNPRNVNAISQATDLHSCALPASQTATDATARGSSSSSEPLLSGSLPTSIIWVTSTSGNHRGSDRSGSFTTTTLPTITVTTVVTGDAAESTPYSESRAEPRTTSTARANPSSEQDGKPPREPPPLLPSLTSAQTPRPLGDAASAAAPDAMLIDGTATVQLFVVDVSFILSDHRATPADQGLFYPQSLDVRPGDSVLFRLHGPYTLYLSN